MIHLTDIQLADAVEDRLDARAAAHLTDCPGCRAKVGGLRAVLDDVTRVPALEPSPLFWDHFGGRVNAAIAEVPGVGLPWLSKGRLAWLAAAAVLLISVIGFQAWQTGPGLSPALSQGETEPHTSRGAAAPELEPGPAAADEDAAWALVSSLADDLHYDDAVEAGVQPAPGSVERAATELPEAERAELIRLIRNEMKRIGA